MTSGLLLALLYGALSGAGLLVGAGMGIALDMQHRVIAAVTALGAGLLLAAASLELSHGAVADVGLVNACMAILAGGLAFSLVNFALRRWGAQDRKRCGECAPQPMEAIVPGSGAAIAAGSLLDAIPEALVLGFAVQDGGRVLPPLALAAAFAFGNFAEGLSSASGMRNAGRWCEKDAIFQPANAQKRRLRRTAGLRTASGAIQQCYCITAGIQATHDESFLRGELSS